MWQPWCLPAVDYYSAINGHELLIHVGGWMDFECLRLSGKEQKDCDLLCDFSFMWHSCREELQEQETGQCLPRAGGEGLTKEALGAGFEGHGTVLYLDGEGSYWLYMYQILQHYTLEKVNFTVCESCLNIYEKKKVEGDEITHVGWWVLTHDCPPGASELWWPKWIGSSLLLN